MSALMDAVFHGITIALFILHFVDAKNQSEINKMQRRSIDKLQRKVKELEEWKK